MSAPIQVGDLVESVSTGARGRVTIVDESKRLAAFDTGAGRDSRMVQWDRLVLLSGGPEHAPEEPESAAEAAQDARGVNPKDVIGATKPNLALVPPAGKIHVALAMANGAQKYGAYNWRLNPVQLLIYLAAAQRHIDQFMDGEDLAADSGVHHLAHAAACLMIVLDALETGNLVDDRPAPGAASALIERHTKGGK